MKAAQISKAGGHFELVERAIPEPRGGQVRVKVEACGICHSDVLVKDVIDCRKAIRRRLVFGDGKRFTGYNGIQRVE